MYEKARAVVKTKHRNSEEFEVKVGGTPGIGFESIIVCGCDGGANARGGCRGSCCMQMI